mgnify:CR=1 FL=1
MMTVHRRIPDETLIEWTADFRIRMEQWFKDNPTRKIAKVEWYYGKQINLRRADWGARITKELEWALAWPPVFPRKRKART